MPMKFALGALALTMAVYLVLRVWRAFSTGRTDFPRLELRRISRSSEAGNFWIAIAMQAMLVAGLLMIALPSI